MRSGHIPLFALLAMACGQEAPASSVETPRPSPESVAPATPSYRLANALDLRRTARRWATLAQAGPANDVYLAPFAGEDWALGVDTDDEARARELAAHFEQEPLPWQAPEAARVRASLVETAAGGVLRETPGGDIARRLPPHCLGVALEGSVSGHRSAPSDAGADAIAHVVYGDHDQGWQPASALRRYEGCLPGTEHLRAHVPIIRSGTHESRALVARVEEPAPAFLFVTRDPRNQRSFAGVFRDLGDCQLEDSWVASVHGMAEYALPFADGAIAVGYVPEGADGAQLRWDVFREGSEAPVLRRDAPRGAVAEVVGSALRLSEQMHSLPTTPESRTE